MNQFKAYGFHYVLRAAILLSFALYIVYLVKNEAMVYYIAPRMEIYVKLSAIGLYILSVYQGYLGIMAFRGKIQKCDCEQIPERSFIKNTTIYSLFIFPLLLGFLLPDATLGSAMAANKGVNLQSSGTLRVSTPVEEGNSSSELTEKDGDDEGTSPNLTDEHSLSVNEHPEPESNNEVPSHNNDFTNDKSDEELKELFQADAWTEFYVDHGIELYKSDVIEVEESIYLETLTTLDLFLENYIGKTMSIRGFVFRTEEMNNDQFVVARFAMECCAADASPYGVLVEFDEAQKLRDDQWIEVTGTVTKGQFNGYDMLLLNAETVQNTDQPADPYVYTNYEFGL